MNFKKRRLLKLIDEVEKIKKDELVRWLLELKYLLDFLKTEETQLLKKIALAIDSFRSSNFCDFPKFCELVALLKVFKRYELEFIDSI